MEQNRDSRFFLSLFWRVPPMCRVRGDVREFRYIYTYYLE